MERGQLTDGHGPAVLYWCDPEKNTGCRKTICRHVLRLSEGGVCEATFHPEFALTDENGEPMVYEKQKEFQEKKAEAMARLKEREERKNVSGVDQQSDLHVQRALPGGRDACRTATYGTLQTVRTA